MHHHTKRIATATMLLGLVTMLVQPAQGDFVRWDDKTMTVHRSHTFGILYDQSKARIISGGDVHRLSNWDASTVDLSGGEVMCLNAYNSSTVDLSGGEVSACLFPYDSSTVHMSGGEVQGQFFARGSSTVDLSGGAVGCKLYAHHSSTVNMSGGAINGLSADHSSTVNISGGQLRDRLYAEDSSTVTFHASDFDFGSGLSLSGDRVLGTGQLSGEWFDGTPWAVEIATNEGTIRAVPEPSAMMLMAVALAGGLLLKKRFSSVKPT